MSEEAVIIFFLILLALYFIPTMIASGKKSFGAIFALNFFLGWTLLGWVAALCWALASPRQEEVAEVKVINSNAMPAPALTTSADRISIRITPGDGPDEGWNRIAVGDPVRLIREGDQWHVEGEAGPLARLSAEANKAVSFRADAVGQPRARVAEVGTSPCRFAVISVGFA